MEIQEFSYRSWPLNKRFNITIIFTYECNFNCSYCFEKNEKKKELNLILFKKIIFNIFEGISELPDIDSIHISIYGGELSIKSLDWHKQLFSIFNSITEKFKKDLHIYYLSNFSQSIKKYLEINKIEKKFNFRFKFTLHHEYFKIDNFINKYLKLNLNNVDLKILNFHLPEDNPNILKTIKKLQKENILFIDSIDHNEYKKDISNLKFFRPVYCYAYNYILDSTGELFHECFNEIRLNPLKKIKFKRKINCNKICGCPALEMHTFKKLKN